ncbi:Eukaryotic aspartyl protease [Musa troglodytarum]|uniref:Eukaryotic aspartyl protease n=1 Tax=Musa troglodytarum TaxID=320322 RepID=A0A9E7FJ49_9LILI|nr:Eukaryotic aspartyl protease [Musa troglodytarum]
MKPIAFALFLAAVAAGAAADGFRVDLIHRDSPRSPLYDPSSTAFDRVRAAAQRSALRPSRFARAGLAASASGDASIEAPLLPDITEYLVEVELGTPKFKVVAIVDTGSDLLWANCKPCTQCYEQTPPLFDPKDSSTYRDLACDSRPCEVLNVSGFCISSKCHYQVLYADGSQADGNLASETFTFTTTGSNTIAIPNITFGCSHQSSGIFSNRTGGIVGLGAGQLSLVSQLGSSIDSKFSYCLVPLSQTSAISKLVFGDGSVPSGSDVLTTPLTIKDSFYYLTLNGISVGNTNISATSPTASGSPNIVIDSGTMLNFLSPEMADELGNAVKDIVDLPVANDPGLSVFAACFHVKGSRDYKFPDITYHFQGAPLRLGPSNTFLEVAQDVVCLAASGAADPPIFGNFAQQNHLVEFDLGANQLSFAQVDCTNF